MMRGMYCVLESCSSSFRMGAAADLLGFSFTTELKIQDSSHQRDDEYPSKSRSSQGTRSNKGIGWLTSIHCSSTLVQCRECKKEENWTDEDWLPTAQNS